MTTNLKSAPKINAHKIKYLWDNLENGQVYMGAVTAMSDNNEQPFSWSLRVLNPYYEGLPLIKVRRSSDNQLADIYSINGELDINGLLGFVGASDGYIHTWYNQTRNDINAIQTTNASQPRIVSQGVIDTVKGRPAIYFDGSQYLSCGLNTNWDFLHYRIISSSSSYCVFQPGITDNPNTAYVIWGTTITLGNRGGYLLYDDRQSVPRNNTVFHAIGTSTGGTVVSLNFMPDNYINTNDLNYVLITFNGFSTLSDRSFLKANFNSIHNNNTANGTQNSGNANHELRIGTAANGSGVNQFYLVGYVQELVFIKTFVMNLRNQVAIDENVLNYYNIS